MNYDHQATTSVVFQELQTWENVFEPMAKQFLVSPPFTTLSIIIIDYEMSSSSNLVYAPPASQNNPDGDVFSLTSSNAVAGSHLVTADFAVAASPRDPAATSSSSDCLASSISASMPAHSYTATNIVSPLTLSAALPHQLPSPTLVRIKLHCTNAKEGINVLYCQTLCCLSWGESSWCGSTVKTRKFNCWCFWLC